MATDSNSSNRLTSWMRELKVSEMGIETLFRAFSNLRAYTGRMFKQLCILHSYPLGF